MSSESLSRSTAILVAFHRQLGTQEVVQTEVFHRHAVKLVDNRPRFHCGELGQARRRQVELEDSAGGLKGLYKTVSGLNIQRFHAHIKLIGQGCVELVEIGLIEWRNEKIPVQRESGHPFLKHRLTADHHITAS